ncbi:hypothetical protein C8Q70DRAFT_102798 [Cubamyces menziesii]|nr:hypothetical protein C8Q70DRAFT_102798 [Cubamyces menziesii]
MYISSRTIKRKPRLTGPYGSDHSTGSSTTIVSKISLSLPPPLPPPPGYVDNKPLPPRPTAVLLSFRQQGFNTMVAYHKNAAEYHVAVYMNCFMPSSFVTVIRRAHEDGEVVSSFEMGISTQRATVNMHGTEKFVDAVLSRTGKKTDDRIWQWKWDEDPNHMIGWHREAPVRYCYILDSAGRPSGPMIAAFVVCSSTSNVRQASPQPASITIYPAGQHIMDHILTSALLVERKRLTPSPMTMNPIFN